MRPYLRFVFKGHASKRWLIIAVVAMIVQFAAFKYLYPFASYFQDSYTYVGAAANHNAVSFRPIGYSRFLSFVHGISASETALVYVQYLLLELAALHFFFSFLFFYQPGKRTRILLFVLLFLNPLLLYLSNYVSSDALFASLSLLWFTGLLWMVNRPRPYQLLVQAAWLFVIIQTRFTALYYPLIGAAALLLCVQRRVFKLTGVLLYAAVTVFCIVRVQNITKSATGTRVFSAFSGWQMANNALHVYCYVEQDTSGMPANCRELSGFVQRYFDKACPGLRRMPWQANTNYMWEEGSPLKKYLYYKWRKDSLAGYFEAWNAVGPLYAGYGAWLIKKHPVAFATHYLWPSAKTYFLPPVEAMGYYNEGVDTVATVAADWFHYSNRRVRCVSKPLEGRVTAVFPAFFLISNLVLAVSISWFLLIKGFRRASGGFSRSLWLVSIFFIVSAGFSVFATPSALRYDIFPLVIFASFSLLMIDWLRRNGVRGGFSRQQ